ncbi:MAG TPA: TIGR02147 family protein [Fibrobacteraceae bacterium]|nr:TIGR02147 family protein [Fibrobacteraceae bacterium]
MPDLFRYTHFGPYLKDWFEEEKASGRGLSLQQLSSRLGLKSKSLMHRLMHDPKATLSPQLAENLSDLIGHDKLEREYFHYLVLFCRVRTPEEKGKLYAHMHRLLERLRPTYVEDWQLDFFQDWYIPAVRELVDCKPFPRSAEDVARRLRPSITATQARRALECLLKLGLIRVRRGGQGWQSTQKALDTLPDFTNAVVHGFQKQMLALAQNSLEKQGLQEREILTTTFAISVRDRERIRTLIRNFQNELTREILSLDASPEQVYQFNLQFFPLSTEEGV